MSKGFAVPYCVGEISVGRLETIRNNFAPGVSATEMIGVISESILDTGRSGWLFADNKFFYSNEPHKPLKIWYEDIERVEINGDPDDDDSNQFSIVFENGESFSSLDTLISKKTLKCFLEEMIELQVDEPAITNDVYWEESADFAEISSGVSAAAFGIRIDSATGNSQGIDNALFDESKWPNSGGHGFAAERANNLYDRYKGLDARITGDNNVKDGPDRVIIGGDSNVWIQSKYCSTGKACIDSCFRDNQFRYYEDGQPMKIEVPSDKYQEAVTRMQERIKLGQVKGVTNPDEARNIVKAGNVTYEQALNIAKAGNIDSITYDAMNGVIISTSAFGISAMVSFATSIWNGESVDIAITRAALSGLKVGGTAFLTTVLASQLSRTTLNSMLIGNSEAIVGILGPKVSQTLINAFRTGGNIYGAAAQKSLAKLLRGNTITAGVSVAVISSFDVIDVFRGRISTKQLVKNVASTSTSVAGGMGGYLGGAALGSMVMPGVGTFVGGIIGSIAAGSAAGAVTKNVIDVFVEDDAVEMIRIIEKEFQNLTTDYMLNKNEAEKVSDHLSNIIDQKFIKDMYADSNRRPAMKSQA